MALIEFWLRMVWQAYFMQKGCWFQKCSLIGRTEDKLSTYGHIMAMCSKKWV